MKGLDALERDVLACIRQGGGKDIPTETLDAAARLLRRGIIAWGPMCICGQHPTVVITPLGEEVERLDLLSRGLL